MRVCSGFYREGSQGGFEELGFAQPEKRVRAGLAEERSVGPITATGTPCGGRQGRLRRFLRKGPAAPLDCPLRGSIGR